MKILKFKYRLKWWLFGPTLLIGCWWCSVDTL